MLVTVQGRIYMYMPIHFKSIILHKQATYWYYVHTLLTFPDFEIISLHGRGKEVLSIFS